MPTLATLSTSQKLTETAYLSIPSTVFPSAQHGSNLLSAMDHTDARVTVMFIILTVSLVAVSFPAISSAGFVRLPSIIFFIGKHFGTGVILATAFIHLLPDSFTSLLSEGVKRKYGDVGRWTGLIILGSLLAIFLVEYISTTYVDRLHSEPSAPPTPSVETEPLPIAIAASPSTVLQSTTALLPFLANSPKLKRLHVLACSCQGGVCVCIPVSETSNYGATLQGEAIASEPHDHHDHQGHHEGKKQVGRRRQIVGIFVLQLGIMIHSLVIGLTLSISSGADFTSLTTAVIFHQLFEGLSLGIRIAALPPKEKGKKQSHESDPLTNGLHDEENHRPQGQPARLVVQTHPAGSSDPLPELLTIPILNLGPTSEQAASKPHPSPSPAPEHSSPYPSPQKEKPRRRWNWKPNALKTTLSFLFAITTPLGMAIGLILWRWGSSNETDTMTLVQGIMSAVSAGMLIYAATVEMIAGDFVFGDVEGHHHHHSPEQGHHHHPPYDVNTQGTGGDHHHEEHGHHEHTKASIGKKALAVLSMLMGVTAMVLIGLGE